MTWLRFAFLGFTVKPVERRLLRTWVALCGALVMFGCKTEPTQDFATESSTRQLQVAYDPVHGVACYRFRDTQGISCVVVAKDSK